MPEVVDEIEVRGTSGEYYTILKRQKTVHFRGLNSTHTVGGTIDYILDTGEAVNENDDGTFVIVSTDEVLRPL